LIQTLVLIKNFAKEKADTALAYLKTEFPKTAVIRSPISRNETQEYFVFHNIIIIHKIHIPDDLAGRESDLAGELQRRCLAEEMRKASSCNATYIISDSGMRVEIVSGLTPNKQYKRANRSSHLIR